MDYTVVIPARYDSSRLPGKPLVDIGGKPMIRHVWERAVASGARAVVIATDDARVEAAARGFGADVCMTGAAHRSGTERIREVVVRRGLPDATLIVNLQGDEPFMPPQLLDQVARDLDGHSDAAIATLCEAIEDAAQMFDPAVVKVVRDHAGFALYFSRAPIPWHREAFASEPPGVPPDMPCWRHIGLYAYRAGYLQRYADAPQSALERCEALEQLRALDRGQRIHVAVAEASAGVGVDTPEDLERARRIFSRGGGPHRSAG